MESKLQKKSYTKLADYISDISKILDNCRFYNPKNSTYFRCADLLEQYFVSKIKDVRKKIVLGKRK